MKHNYDYALTQLLKDEGGYSNHPDDKGGPTNYGITIADYRKYIKANGTATDVKNMKLEDAKKIYKLRYWDVLKCDDLPSGVDYCVFDYGVNSGVARPVAVLKKITEKDPVKLIDAICNERLGFMKRIRGGKDWAVFGKGWQRRVDGVRKNSKLLVSAKSLVPTGAGTAAGTVVGGVATYSYWNYVTDHWFLFLLGAIGIGILLDLAIAVYKNEKANKNV